MNDFATRKAPVEISLANEPPFDLASARVRPAALEVEQDGEVTALEPRVMQVLVALHRSHGEPVSRDALIDLCWGGRVVTDGALNRCVAQLRKALGANPRIRVETIPKVGYRLRTDDATNGRAIATNGADDPQSPIAASVPETVPPASVAAKPASAEAVPGAATTVAAPIAAPPPETVPPASVAAKPAATSAESSPSPQPKPRNWKLTAAGLLTVIIATAAIWALSAPRPVTWTAAEYRPITTEPGLEVYPALSPNGEQIVYSAKPDPFAPMDLFLRNVDQGTPLRLTTGEAEDYSAAWSPNGDRIAFTRSPLDGPCSLIVVPIPRGPERVATRCQVVHKTRASWLDARTLVFADQPRADMLPRIRAVDVQTGDTRDLTTPPATSLGDTEPVVAPDGRHIAFRRALMIGADDLYVLDVTTGRERALTQDGWKASGFVWSNDSRHVFFSSNRSGEFGLWSADLLIQEPPRQVSLGLGAISFSRMSADLRNRLVVEISRGGTNLYRASPSGTIEPVTLGSGYDWDAAPAADGTVAHISNRSGSYQVWLARPGADPLRLTSLPASYVMMPAWSPDERVLAFVAVAGHRAEIYTVARDGSQLHKVTNDGASKQDPVYSVSGDRIYYIARLAGTFRLMQIGLAPGSQPQVVPGGAGWRVLRTDRAGRLYGQRGTSILTLDPSPPIPDVGLTYADVWTAGTQGIYVRRGKTPQHPAAVWLYPWSGPARKIADTPLASSSIAVDKDGAVLFTQSTDYQCDLGLIELRNDS
jgi:Tol biopolymer transport system component/DNA-binding winged helix-turn-helix (wHTH) protein